MGTNGLAAEIVAQAHRPRLWIHGKPTHVDAVVTLGDQPVKLLAAARRISGEQKAVHRVLVNGRVVKEVTRPADRREMPVEAPLGDYAGQTVVLTLVSEIVEDGRGLIGWGEPRLVPVD